MFFATLICALLLGLSYGVLYLRDRHKEYNKLELAFLKIPTPPLKITITILIIALLVLCWKEATYVDSTGMKFLLLIWHGISVSMIALFAFTLIHPAHLKNPSALALCNKYYLAHNLSAMLLFVALSITALWLQTLFYPEMAWNITFIGIAGLAVVAVFYLLYSIVAILIFIYYILIGLYHLAKWLNKTYWDWVQSV